MGAVVTGIRQAAAAAATISAVALYPSGSGTRRWARNPRTILVTDGLPSRSPCSAGTTRTSCGSGQTGSVTASASGTSSSQRSG